MNVDLAAAAAHASAFEQLVHFMKDSVQSNVAAKWTVPKTSIPGRLPRICSGGSQILTMSCFPREPGENRADDTGWGEDDTPLLGQCVPGLGMSSCERLNPVRLCEGCWLRPAHADPGLLGPDGRTPIPAKWVKGQRVKRLFEGSQIEFKQGRSDLADRLASDVERYGNAFVNTRGGLLIYGVTDSGVVDGVRLPRSARDRLSNEVGCRLARFSPVVPPQCYRLAFFPLQCPRRKTQTAARGRDVVVEVIVRDTAESAPSVRSFRVPVDGPEKQTGRQEEQEEELCVIVFCMAYHKTGSSYFVSLRNNLAFALQRVESTTQFVRVRMIGKVPPGCESENPREGTLEEMHRAELEVLSALQERQKEEDKVRKEIVTKTKESLPAWRQRGEIAESIMKNRVVLIHGPTSCGKSTQVPQVILNSYGPDSLPPKIVVAQPRRISAVSLAKRVADEYGVTLGSEVGYQVGKRKQFDDSSRIVFMTYGMLKIFLRSGSVDQFTHFVLDEVHERQVDMDLCLSLLLRYAERRPQSRLVIMSATLDIGRFARYCGRFSLFQNTILAGHDESVCSTETVEQPSTAQPEWLAKVVRLEGRRHPIELAYLDDILGAEDLERVSREFDARRPRLTDSTRRILVTLIESICDRVLGDDGTEPEEGEEPAQDCTAEDEISESEESSNDGKDEQCHVDPDRVRSCQQSVLVFLPGISTILGVYDSLNFSRVVSRLEICTLHGSCSIDEQRRILGPPFPGKLKVVLCTNVAESSLTVPDASVVIDSCLCRQMEPEPSAGTSSLCDSWISHESATQRMGRTGRVQAGNVIRLVPRHFYENELPAKSTPEIQRIPLEDSTLHIIGNRLQGVEETLAGCIDPPTLQQVSKTLTNLVDLGIAIRTPDPVKSTIDTSLTPLGVLVSRLPVSWKLGNFLVYCHCFGLLNHGMVVAAVISMRDLPFRKSVFSPLKHHEAMIRFSGGFRDDIIATSNAYYWWQSNREHMNVGGTAAAAIAPPIDNPSKQREKDNATGSVAEYRWCEMNSLHLPTLREIADVVYQLRVCLAECGICRLPKKSETARRAMYMREQIEHDCEEDARMPVDDEDSEPPSHGTGSAASSNSRKIAVSLPSNCTVGKQDDTTKQEIIAQYQDINGTLEEDCEEGAEYGVEDALREQESREPPSHRTSAPVSGWHEWKTLKFNEETKDEVLALQSLIAASYPDNMLEITAPDKYVPWQDEDRLPPQWKKTRTALLKVQGASTVNVSDVSKTMRSCGVCDVPRCHREEHCVWSIFYLPDNSVDSRLPYSRTLSPPFLFSEGVVRSCKLRCRPDSWPSTQGTPLIDTTLPCLRVEPEPSLMAEPRFAFQRGALSLLLDRFSLSSPASSASFVRYAVAPSVIFQKSAATMRTTCIAKTVCVFPDDAKAMCQIVPLVFLRNTIYRERKGVLKVTYNSCKMRRYLTLPDQVMHSVKVLRDWIECCMAQMFRGYERWPLERSPEDHIIALEGTQVTGLPFNDGLAANQYLLDLLRSNSIIASSAQQCKASVGRFFPSLTVLR